LSAVPPAADHSYTCYIRKITSTCEIAGIFFCYSRCQPSCKATLTFYDLRFLSIVTAETAKEGGVDIILNITIGFAILSFIICSAGCCVWLAVKKR